MASFWNISLVKTFKQSAYKTKDYFVSMGNPTVTDQPPPYSAAVPPGKSRQFSFNWNLTGPQWITKAIRCLSNYATPIEFQFYAGFRQINYPATAISILFSCQFSKSSKAVIAQYVWSHFKWILPSEGHLTMVSL